MSVSSNQPNRKRNRLSGYDYRNSGWYFVTICTFDREYILSAIEINQVHLTKLGEICLSIWNSLPDRFPNITLDEFVVMPNHIHGILRIEASLNGHSLSDIVGAYKSLVAREYYLWYRDIIGYNTGKIWQKSFNDHIIKNRDELNTIRNYIRHNPANWNDDPEHLKH